MLFVSWQSECSHSHSGLCLTHLTLNSGGEDDFWKSYSLPRQILPASNAYVLLSITHSQSPLLQASAHRVRQVRTSHRRLTVRCLECPTNCQWSPSHSPCLNQRMKPNAAYAHPGTSISRGYRRFSCGCLGSLASQFCGGFSSPLWPRWTPTKLCGSSVSSGRCRRWRLFLQPFSLLFPRAFIAIVLVLIYLLYTWSESEKAVCWSQTSQRKLVPLKNSFCVTVNIYHPYLYSVLSVSVSEPCISQHKYTHSLCPLL